ncbi:MAG TPA: DUF3717 domain-containing protein [Burkholderiaceae bacterium]|nr:DUF3717 domain-containing protein [Burkholderiaceae bacterium]
MDVSLQDLEAAINWWRNRRPAQGESMTLAPEVAALAKPYALLIWRRQASLPAEQLSEPARAALATWRSST